MNELLVSIIVPIYNTEKYLEQCIESIIRQRYQNLEIIFIDDGSTDNSAEIIKKFKVIDDRINYYYMENQGVSSARNKGVSLASGQYLYFIDSDDWIQEDTIYNLINAMQESQSQFAFSNRYFVYENCSKIMNNDKQNRIFIQNEIVKEYMLYKYRAWVGGAMFEKKLWYELNLVFPRQKYCEDFLVIMLYICNVDRAIYLSEPLYYYRIRNDSAIHSKNPNILFDEGKTVKKIMEYAENKITRGIYQAFGVFSVNEIWWLAIHYDLSDEMKQKIVDLCNEIIYMIGKGYLKNKDLKLKQKIKFLLCRVNLNKIGAKCKRNRRV